jgi:hypothetical protein
LRSDDEMKKVTEARAAAILCQWVRGPFFEPLEEVQKLFCIRQGKHHTGIYRTNK